jgi:lysophospholipase L1-like esterase
MRTLEALPFLRLRRFVALAAAAVLASGCAHLGSGPAWVGTWAAAPTGPASLQASADFVPSVTLQDQTLRMIVRSSIAGSEVRVRFSNEIGDAPAAVRIGAARIALRGPGSALVAGTDRALTFGGQPSVTIPPKGHVLSDPVVLDVPALADLAVSLFLPDRTVGQSGHHVTRQTSYMAPGNETASPALPANAKPLFAWFVLTGIDVKPKQANASALVALGDSITDGFGEPVMRGDAPAPWLTWPNRLAERLQGHATLSRLAVLNAGISGNRVLNDAAQSVPPAPAGVRAQAIFGERAVARFGRDVARQSGAACVVVLEGINDIGQGPSRGQVVSADQLMAGYRQLIASARAANLRVIGGTLTPFQGYAAPYYSDENEAKRQAVNAWIRNGAGYDAVIDFDAMVRDPAQPSRLNPPYDSGDHLHPSDAGYKAMADGVDFATLERHCLR